MGELNAALFARLRRALEISPLPEQTLQRLRGKWLRELRATKKRLTLRALADEIKKGPRP